MNEVTKLDDPAVDQAEVPETPEDVIGTAIAYVLFPENQLSSDLTHGYANRRMHQHHLHRALEILEFESEIAQLSDSFRADALQTAPALAQIEIKLKSGEPDAETLAALALVQKDARKLGAKLLEKLQ